MVRSVVLTACAALALGACSASMSLDDYAETMTASTEAYVVESQNLSYDYQSAVEDGVRAIVESGDDDAAAQATELMRRSTVEYLALLLDAMGRFVEQIDGLDAPADLAEDHDEYLAAVWSVYGAIPEAQDQVRSAESLEDIERAFTASTFADGQPRWTASCERLEVAIVEAGGSVDLRCVRTEPRP